MRSAQYIRLLALLLLVGSALLFGSSATIRISESEMSAVISGKEISLAVPVLNESGSVVSGILYVELLDPKDAVVASSQTSERFNPGRNSINLNLARPMVSTVSDNDPVLWYRVFLGPMVGIF